MTPPVEIFTVGHSNHSADDFIALLRKHDVGAIADVRSQPFSRYASQFNKAELKVLLQRHGIRYAFLGSELGARSDRPECYVAGRVQFDRLARTDEFGEGLDRVLQGSEHQRVALMCTEKDPLDCHRTILVAERLVMRGATVTHIRADGTLEAHPDAIERLMTQLRIEPDLFRTREELVRDALDAQERKIAYVDPELASMSDGATQ